MKSSGKEVSDDVGQAQRERHLVGSRAPMAAVASQPRQPLSSSGPLPFKDNEAMTEHITTEEALTLLTELTERRQPFDGQLSTQDIDRLFEALRSLAGQLKDKDRLITDLKIQVQNACQQYGEQRQRATKAEKRLEAKDAALKVAGDVIERLRGMVDLGDGHGGSPMEWVYEVQCQIDTALQRKEDDDG